MPNQICFSFNLLNLLKHHFHLMIEFEKSVDKFQAISESLQIITDLMGASSFRFYFKKVDYFAFTLFLKFFLR